MATRKKSGGRKSSSKKSSSRKSSSRKKSSARKSSGRKTRRKSSSSGKKRTPNAAFMAPKQPDAALSAVVGTNPIPRTEITKKLWQYIKRNGLQDAKERRMINADDKLKVVFGGKTKVSMFEMTKLVNKHIK